MGLIEELMEKIRHGGKKDFEEAEDQIVVYSIDLADALFLSLYFLAKFSKKRIK